MKYSYGWKFSLQGSLNSDSERLKSRSLNALVMIQNVSPLQNFTALVAAGYAGLSIQMLPFVRSLPAGSVHLVGSYTVRVQVTSLRGWPSRTFFFFFLKAACSMCQHLSPEKNSDPWLYLQCTDVPCQAVLLWPCMSTAWCFFHTVLSFPLLGNWTFSLEGVQIYFRCRLCICYASGFHHHCTNSYFGTLHYSVFQIDR